MSASTSATLSTFVTIQKFLCAFLDRLSKAKLAIERIDPDGKEIGDIRQLSTRIIQQWNILFPNSPIHSIDDITPNTLIATKTREEVVLDRSSRQKQKLLMEVEVLRTRLNQQEAESASLTEEINQFNKQIETEDSALQHLQQQRHALVNTLSSLQTQKQRESSELQSLQSAKLSILEELVNLQHTIAAHRTSIEALQSEKRSQSSHLEQLRSEQLLLSHELQVLQQQRQALASSVQQTRDLITQSVECANPTDTHTSGLSSATHTATDPAFDTMVVRWSRPRGWKRSRQRSRQRRGSGEAFGSVRRPLANDTNIFADDSFWWSVCYKQREE